jgi:RNA 3'-terminal phosphate cyclase (ATP)
MIEIDGGYKSGSGTIVRDAVLFSALLGKELYLKNIRAKREKPGLRAQHLKGIEAAAQICHAQLEGAKVGSSEIRLKPGEVIIGGKFNWDIGTAGSTTMLASSVIPLALFADGPSTYNITGGLFQDFAPSVYHLKYVLLPILKRMGININLEIIQPGYVPKGNGQIEVQVIPLKDRLKPLTLSNQDKITEIKGIALSSMLKERKVSERMAKECQRKLTTKRYDPKIEIIYDTREHPSYQRASIQAGASLGIWAKTDTGCLIGSDMAGARGRTSEFIGKKVARNLIEDLESGATVDRHLADQLIPFTALAEGWSTYVIPKMTDHIETRLWLVDKILGARTEVKSNLVRIKGIGYGREQ